MGQRSALVCSEVIRCRICHQSSSEEEWQEIQGQLGTTQTRQTPKPQHKESWLLLSDHPQKKMQFDCSVPTRAAETPPLPPGLFTSDFLPTALLLLRVTEAMSDHGPMYNHPER